MSDERDPTKSIDDLFSSPAADEKKGKAEVTYYCARCDASFPSAEPLKYCGNCGGPVDVFRSSASKKVLLVDDSQLARKKIGAILKKLGCRVVEAEDGRKGLAVARIAHPQLIILDVQMPNMDGLECLRTLRQDPHFAATPILMMTVEADAQVVTQALAAKANDYIRKDTSVGELLSRLKKHISTLP